MTTIQCSLSHAFTGKALNSGETDAAKAHSFQAQIITLEELVSHVTEIGGAWTPATFSNGHRKSDNYMTAQLLALDLDNGKYTQMQLKSDPRISEYAAIIHHTPTSSKEHPKHRIIFILDMPIDDRARFERAQTAAIHHYRYLDPDTQTRDAARFYYGNCDKAAYYQLDKRLPMAVVKQWWMEYQSREPENPPTRIQNVYQHQLAELRAAPEGERNETLNRTAYTLFGLVKGGEAGITREQIEADLTAIAQERGLTPVETEATLKSAWEASKPISPLDKQIDIESQIMALSSLAKRLIQAQKMTLPEQTKQIANQLKEVAEGVLSGEQTEADLVPDTTDLIIHENAYIKKQIDAPNMIIGLQSGIPQFDQITGGFQEGIYNFVGETGGGKSTLLASLCWHILMQTIVLVFTTEMTPKRWLRRLVGYLAKIPYSDIARGCHYDLKSDTSKPFTVEEKDSIRHTLEILYDYRAKLKFGSINSPTPAQIKKAARAVHERGGLGCIIIDSLDNVTLGYDAPIFERVSVASQCAKDIAITYSIPVLCSVQGGRNTKNRARADKILRLQDAVGSHRIETDAEFHASIYDPYWLKRHGEIDKVDESMYPPGTAKLLVNKNRAGEDGVNLTLEYKPGIGFYPYERVQERPQVRYDSQGIWKGARNGD